MKTTGGVKTSTARMKIPPSRARRGGIPPPSRARRGRFRRLVRESLQRTDGRFFFVFFFFSASRMGDSTVSISSVALIPCGNII